MDLVVTVPKFLWPDWIEEGDPAGAEESILPADDCWAFYVGRLGHPPIKPGERLYIVSHARLRGYAPVTSVEKTGRGWAICRRGGAVAVTIPKVRMPGFRGYRGRWWPIELERPFPDWQTADVEPKFLPRQAAKQ